jgi:hypothetical protein
MVGKTTRDAVTERWRHLDVKKIWGNKPLVPAERAVVHTYSIV